MSYEEEDTWRRAIHARTVCVSSHTHSNTPTHPHAHTDTHTHTHTHLYITRALVTAPSLPGRKARGKRTRSINSGSIAQLPTMRCPLPSLPNPPPPPPHSACSWAVSREISEGDQSACQIVKGALRALGALPAAPSRAHPGAGPW
jgi:hypothetical protein